MSISRVFDIAGRSLSVYQRALDVTSHNIVNANNPDYARQKVIFGSERSETVRGGEIGAGVKIDDVTRIKNYMTETQIRSYNQKYSDTDKRSSVLGQVESLFSEPSDLGLSNMISSFFNSWDEMASSPNSIPLRNNVIQSASKLSNKIQSVYDGLNQIQEDIKGQVEEKVDEINTSLQEIQTLNKQINESKVTNQSVNDLMDRRDKKIDELSKIVNINVHTDDRGAVSISIGGIFAADEFSSSKFKTNLSNGKLSLTSEDGSATATLNGGELNALTDMYSNQIPEYQNSINTIAQNIMDSVNNIHKTGFDLNNNTGQDFFTSYSGGVLKFISNPSAIAASAANALGTGEKGNSDIAVAIAKLSDSKMIGGSSIGDYYNSMISGIGALKSSNDQSAESNQLVLDQLTMQRNSDSGVSVDEEMTNVIKFQKSYEASAKLIKVSDDMLQTLLNMV
ncbi:MAG: flagellar hook-associated protein FlgK [Ignavibacteriales bacterium]